MDSDPRVDARAPITRRRDAVARALVWSAWLATTLAAVVCLLAYARNVPITEDWTLVPALTGNQPDLPSWLWSQNNEHRVPLPRAVLLALLALSHDFRAGMVFNVAVLAALAAAMIRTSATLRGRTSLTDVFFPIVFLHLGNWENLFWSWQLSFVLPVTLACGFLLLLLRRPALATPGAALLAAACVASLPLCGAIGLAFVPALAGWIGISGSLAWRDAGAGSRRAADEPGSRFARPRLRTTRWCGMAVSRTGD